MRSLALAIFLALCAKMQRAIGLTIRYFFPDTPIFQMGRTRPDMAGNCFVTGEPRDDFLRAAVRILRRDEIHAAAILKRSWNCCVRLPGGASLLGAEAEPALDYAPRRSSAEANEGAELESAP